jgi:valyl-tRNA synthetase
MDWNISRQIVWGIPIPAKICTKCDSGYVDLDDKLTKCEKCGGELKKDLDTFDTWFSSAQWPFVTLGFPDSKDFKNFYPTDVMETAGEIIFFWVSRMIMMGLYMTGKVPFKTVYLHGLVLDAKGQKMSKSKGNVIDPLMLTSKFGTDAFRMGLVVGNTPGTSLALSEDKVSGYKKFVNKLWNVARFVISTAEGERGKPSEEGQKIDSNTEAIVFDPKFKNWDTSDSVHLKRLVELTAEITNEMDTFKFYIAAEKIYHYVWHEFADKIIEESKQVITGAGTGGKNGAEIISRVQFLLHALRTILKLLHPFMPFVTEEIWSEIEAEKSLLMVENWPS